MRFLLQPYRRRRPLLSFTLAALVVLGSAFIAAHLLQLPVVGAQSAVAALTESDSARTESAQANQISITGSGFDPTTLTTTVGIPVIWLNTSGVTQILHSGTAAQSLFLPLVSRDGNATSARAADTPTGPRAPAQAEATFPATVPPGKSFTHTFSAAGTFPFYLESAPELVGRVVVVENTTPPPDPATVAPPLDPTGSTGLGEATSFLYTGSNPIQTGVVSGTIEAQLVAVLRGKVFTRAGAALPAVRISVLGHPEFGQTLSRADGLFDLAVNGGGQLTLRYEKSGFLSAQRAIDAPWRDFAWLPDVVLIPYDTAVTPVELNAGKMQVARGSPVSDADGDRQATILFPQGTTATLTLPDGSVTPLTALNVRATEYTVGASGPQAMPAALPPSSGYTYAAEFSVDEAVAVGATDVRFSQPLPVYIENFLGFPVGNAVPTGYYDRQLGQWVASANGRVIKILSITAGLAALDIDGSGAAADAPALAALGVSDAERANLAQLYTPGQTLWRVPISHFTPWDCNNPVGPPPDASPPPSKPKDKPKPDKPKEECGSIIGCENQALGESIPIVGTSWRLHYQSDRKDNLTLTVPVSDGTVPASLRGIRVIVDIAGKRYQQNFAPAPNLSYTFTWDTKDAYGRIVQGSQIAEVEVAYDYTPQYYAVFEDFVNSFAKAEAIGPGLDIYRSNGTITLAQVWSEIVDFRSMRGQGLGGWNLSIQHTYDPVASTLLFGDGRRRSNQTLQSTISTVAGNSDFGPFSGDGGPATEASLSNPFDVAVGPDGSLYIADNANSRIRRVGTDGIITTVAGVGGFDWFGGDGGPAVLANLHNPTGVAVAADGSLYIADRGNSRIRRVGMDGIITTVAGGGTSISLGDGGPATAAYLDSPFDIAIGPDGSLYIADSGNLRVRRVAPDGIITTVAGNGTAGFSGDGGPAVQAPIWTPRAVAVGVDGSLYIADYNNRRIRRVGPDGIISTVAGNGERDFYGDGGPATEAAIREANGIAVDADGGLYISDSFNRRIRYVGTDGIISTFAGNGDTETNGENGPALGSSIIDPYGLAVGADASLYIVDRHYYRVRRVRSVLPNFSPSDILLPAEDGSELYLFSRSGRHLKTLDGLTGALRYRFGYSVEGYLTSVTDGSGNVTTFERTGVTPTAIVAPGGQRTVLGVNGDGWLSSVANPAGETHSMTYGADGLLAQFTDPLARVHRFTYDSAGRLIKDENPAGGSTTLSRVEDSDGYTVTTTSALGRKQTYRVEELPSGSIRRTITGPSGATTVALINADGSQQIAYADGSTAWAQFGPDPRWKMLVPRLIAMERSLPGGQVETTTGQYTARLADPNNLLSVQALTDTVTVNGRAFTRIYDAATRTMTDTSAEGRQNVSVLDSQGRVIQQTLAPGVAPIAITYDSQGRVVEDRQGGQFWTFAYDTRQRVSSRTDASGKQIVFGYDSGDRLVQKTMPSGATVHYSYDAVGNRTQVVLPSGASHSLQYTPLDQSAAYTPPGNPAYQRSYNLDRELTKITLPGGSVTTQSYDTGGRVTGVSDSEGATAFAYGPGDPTERVAVVAHTPVTGPAQTLAYSYNGPFITSTVATGIVPVQISYSYDNDFFLTSMNLTSGLNSIQTPVNRDKDGLLTGFGPFAFARGGPGGALSQISEGTLNASYGYDALARLRTRTHQVNSQAVYALQLGYDSIGQIISRTETVGSTDLFSYTYDLDGRLTTVRRNGVVSEAYTYDLNGNRISQRLGGGATETASYDSQDRLLQLGTVGYQFNADGFLTQRGSDTFHYNGRGQLLQAVVSGQTISYSYDGLGRRVSRTDSTGVTQYIYADPSSALITAVRSPAGIFTALYYDTGGLLIALERSGVRYYVATDQVGTPRTVSDIAGANVKVLTYDSFGRLLTDSAPAFDLPLGYAGGLADGVTGLVHFGRRDYEPASGRWTARDPVIFAGGQGNLYVYVGSSPIQHRDPTGLFCISVSVYDGIGAGAQTCITTEGVSVCGEVGFGIGGGAGVDNGGLAKNGGTLGLEVGAKCGPVGAGAEISLDTDGCLKGNGNLSLGPLKLATDKGEVSEDGSSKNAKINADCSATGKLNGKFCHQEKW